MKRHSSLVLAMVCSRMSAADMDLFQELDQNDECSSDMSCALSALQMKGKQMLMDLPACSTTTELNAECSLSLSPDDNAELGAGAEASLGGDGEADLGSSPIRHYARGCWRACGRRSGMCEGYCGSGNACCRYGFPGQPRECQQPRFWPIIHKHTCVQTRWHPAAPAAQGSVPQSGPIQGNNVRKMYQMTSPQNALSIINGHFHVGSGGWCGGAIYMIDHPHLKTSKYNPRTTSTGAYVEITVNLGKLCRYHRTCNDGRSGKCCTGQDGSHGIAGAAAAGCNSIVWDPGDGDEYIIWNTQGVISKQIYSCDKPECAKLFPKLHR